MANEYAITLPEGLVQLRMPESMSLESYNDLDQWVQLLLRIARRNPESEACDS